ncbi:MAG: hypothetical protein CVT63_03245 [Candidatus Anoxymicrobium japonicum]|uniref:DNA-binding protein n=1 Tax=Candidatus Anoxymicrobium japonicum TaxID=2013648 RepID=A0A2N3G6I8_9ACTN|nr:MAG: hypothetical protein CVT63_03245 [Candidatus Anoxymicrobium japonicum]
MRKPRQQIIIAVSLAILCAGLLCAAAAATSVSAGADGVVTTTELVENMRKYDNRTITIQGEAVGDMMTRGVFAWITVNDDAYSKKSVEEGGKLVGISNMGIAVWVPEQQARKIKVFGGYKNKGSTVRITGVFHRACARHGGDTDIHADSIEVVAQGQAFSRSFEWDNLIAFIILVAAILILWNARRWGLSREKKEK